jgi:uncharacterized Tic20 family protein
VTAVADDREQQLAWEARQRPRAGVLAIVASVLLLGGFLWWVSTLSGSPKAGYLESLANLGDGPIGEQPSVQPAAAQYSVDNALAFIGSALARGVAPLALAWTLMFLGIATRARRPEFPRFAIYVPFVGAVLFCLGTVGAEIDRVIAFNQFLDSPRTVDDARDAISNVTITVALLSYVGQFILAAGVLLVSLNAMRAGLLTRFLGILGVVSGVVLVFPQLIPLPLIQAFWLIALGLMLLGRGRTPLPPAWRTGKAEPWPSAKEAAERRREAEERRQGIVPEPKPKPAPAAKTHPSSKKRSRKRRN